MNKEIDGKTINYDREERILKNKIPYIQYISKDGEVVYLRNLWTEKIKGASNFEELKTALLEILQ